MTILRRAVLAFALASGAVGCRAGTPGGGGGAPPQSAAGAAATAFSITERAEPGAITALAFHPPYLFAGSAHGLRRWDVRADEFEWIGTTSGLLDRNVTALAADADGEIWIATGAGVGRLSVAADGTRYQAVGPLARITLLAPLSRPHGDGAWAAGAAGLFWIEGRSSTPVEALRDVAITSLDLDGDGRAVWAGTRGRGLFRVDAQRAQPMLGADQAAPLDEIVGTAVTAAGTRLVAGRAGDGGRLVVMSSEAGQRQIETFRAQPDAPVVRLLDSGGDAVLVAGPVGAPRAFRLRPLYKGETLPPGALRFVPMRRAATGRWAAVPLPDIPPPHVTTVATAGGAFFFGTERMGVAQGKAAGAQYLSGAELVGDAERLHVACASAQRCYLVTDGPRAWLTDGDRYAETRVGETDEASVLAVVADSAGVIYALSAEPRFTGLVITKLAAADLWQPFLRVPLKMPAASPPALSMAAISPEGTLWVGLRAEPPGGGDSVGFGAVEIDLGTKHVVQHRPTKPDEAANPETLPLPAGLTGVLFDKPALWFASLGGVSRWQQGELRNWGENEGMQSELAHALAKGPDGKIWAATSEGLARFDGKDWRPAPDAAAHDGGGGAIATRGLVRDGRGRMWVATARGLRVITPADAPALRPTATVLAGDFRDVALDRLGRVWALSTTSIALIDASR